MAGPLYKSLHFSYSNRRTNPNPLRPAQILQRHATVCVSDSVGTEAFKKFYKEEFLMRNLKKVLSLVLCVAMMLSVMVVGAGAAFSDQSKIKNTEAVDACTALNIIGGYPDGSFKPEGNITRAEVTKMICVALNGGKNPAVSTNTTPTFSDVRNNANAAWAEGYIESCAAQGIVSGVGGGKFAPNGNVTGVQLAKMLLVSLGYKSENEGFTGNAWATNVNVRAAQKGLYEGLEKMDTSAAITRDNAAQMVWNALQAYEVEYKTTLTTDSKGQLTSQITVQDKVDGNFQKITLMQDKYEAKKVDAGILLTCSKVDGKDYYSITTEDGTSYNKIYTDVSDLIGQKVQLLKKTDSSTNEVTIYGVYADEDSKVVATSTVGVLDTVKNESAKVKVDGTEYKTDKNLASVQVIYPNEKSVPSSLDTLSEVVAAKNTYPAYAVKLIDNDGNNKIDLVVVTPKDVKEVTYVGSSSATVGGKSYKFDDADIYKNIAKDDWAVIVAGDYTVTGDPVITKADSVSGKVNGVKSGSPVEVKIDNTWYKLTSSVSTPDVGDEITAAVVGNYVYDIDTTSASAKSILFISANDAADNDLSTDYTVDARAYFTDGTNKKITVDKLNGNDIAAPTRSTPSVVKDAWANKMYTYTTDKDGNYELKALANASTGVAKNLAGYDYYNNSGFYYDKSNGKTNSATKDTSFYSKRLNGTLIAEDAVIFVKASNEIKVISGKTVRDWSNGLAVTNYGFLTDETNGIDYVKVAAVGAANSNGEVPSADGDKLYAYLADDSFETKKDGDTVTQFNVVVGNSTETTTLYEDGTSNVGKAAGSVIVYTVDGDKINVKAVVSATDYIYNTSGAYAIKGFDGKTEGDITLVNKDGDIVSATLDKDCVFIGVDDAKNVGTTSNIGAVPTTADKDEYDRYDMNAYVVFNSDGDVVAIVYDTVNNELDIDNVKTATADTTTYTVTGFSGKTETIANETTSKVTTLAGTSAKAGANSTLTVTLSSAITGKDATVIVNGDNGVGNVSIVVKAGKTSGTATFTMPKADTTFTFVSAAVAK